MRLSNVVVMVALVGCARDKQKEPRFEGPMPVNFGDCAGPTTTWVSGPKPLPFTPEEANSVSKDDAPVTAAAEPKDDPPPPEPSDGPQTGAFASLTGTGDISSGFDDTNIYGGLLGNEADEMNGGFGFGRSGFGPGGGGTGWGTIGTGRYGKIGHGAGTGSGYGVGGGRGGMRGRTAAVPAVSIGQPNAQGDLDKAIIRRYIKRNIQKIAYCYEKELLVKPKLAGTVKTEFFITPNGNVAKASASGVDKNVADCVASVLKDIEFPKPKGGGGVQVNYPFTFRPAGDDSVAASPPPPADAGSAAGDPIAAVGGGSAAAPAAVAPPMPPPPTPTPRALFRADRKGLPTNYVPGTGNPLALQGGALVECLRKSSTHYGVIVVDLTYDAQGKATNVDPHGLSDERARKCFIEAAKNATHTGTQAERCSLSFGEMPVTSLPSIDITADAITFEGKQIETTKAVIEGIPGTRITPLTEAIEKKAKQAYAAGAPTVALHGPIVVKPLDATPMSVVWRVLMSTLAGGDDVVLASAQGSEWKLVSPMALPVVPVPLATGGVWNRVKSSSLAALFGGDDEDERVVLSILVTKDTVWVGLSRVNEFTQFPRGPDLEKKLLENLKEQKQSAFFADRTDVEIAGEGPVTYGEVLPIIRAADTAGFSAWRIAHPQRLAARPQL